MACILHIETSTDTCSVAVSQDGLNIYDMADTEGRNHAVVLADFVRDTLSFADSHAIPVDAVAISKGPGSYTGLRIGVSLAKGVCFARQIPLIAVDTLKVLCVPLLLRESLPENALLCPMIDARRMEVYCALYNRALRTVQDTKALVVDENSFREVLDSQPVAFIGRGSTKCRDVIKHENALFFDDVRPLAKNMLPLAEMKLMKNEIEDTAYFEPFYLKEFVAGVSTKLQQTLRGE